MEKWLSKVLLFGEYTVIDRGQALAIPQSDYFGYWEKNRNDVHRQNLVEFLAYLKKSIGVESWISPESLVQFSQDIKENIAFQSNIPIGYGLGSSGALVAAWYSKYIEKQNLEISSLQKRLAFLESYFHGSSSGFDPLVAFLNKMILIRNGTPKVIPVSKLALPAHISLFDTKISRSTAPLVKIYNVKKENLIFRAEVIPNLKEFNRLAIEAYLLSDWQNLHETVYQISKLQWEFFKEMIPESIQPLWKSGLDSGDKVLKLCGAGGGGMLLQFEY